jgi:hypothetical protein
MSQSCDRSWLCLNLRFVQLVDEDRLHRAGGRRSQDTQTLGIIGIRVKHECFLPTELENVRRKWNALRVSQAPIQINDNSHILGSFDYVREIAD